MMFVAQNINNSTLRSENKLAYLEQPFIPLPLPVAPQAVHDTYQVLFNAQNEVTCLMLASMSPQLSKTLENYKAYDMIQELKTMGGKIQKDKKKLQGAKGKDKGKTKLAYAPKPKIPPPLKRDNPTKDSICHHYKEVGHWRRNWPAYHAELKMKRNAIVANTLSIFTIELYSIHNKSWLYDTGCGTHICNKTHDLWRRKNLKHGALNLYVGNGMRVAIKAIGSFDLILPNRLVILLDNCHYAPFITSVLVNFLIGEVLPTFAYDIKRQGLLVASISHPMKI
ncbi:hypothetical protein Tco_0393439 [Tanacetum coccineum]